MTSFVLLAAGLATGMPKRAAEVACRRTGERNVLQARDALCGKAFTHRLQ